MIGQVSRAQENFVISGHISDSLTHEPLVGATVSVQTAATGSQTDTAGDFKIPVKRGEHLIRISYIGYHTHEFILNVQDNTRIEISLGQFASATGTVIITARNPRENTESTKTGFVEISARDLRKLPSLMGEPDLIRALYYSPGIQSANDGNSGFYVRGGNVDQNLILLDNAIVYNPSHVLGFFSVFNSDVISNASLIKSGIPASYGGRISSVLAIKTIDGDFEKYSASASMGLLYSKATIQGPLVKNKLSFYISFRKSYVNLIAKPLLSLFMSPDSGGVLNGSKYGMYDLNAKLTLKPGNRNRFSLTAYKGHDNFLLHRQYQNYDSDIHWGNTILAFNWNFLINDSSYLINSLNYSNYEFDYRTDQHILGIKLYSSVKNINYKLEYSGFAFRNGLFKAGAEARLYRFIPNKFVLSVNQVNVNYSSYQNLYAGELAAFASWEKDVAMNLRIYGGLRLTRYSHAGPYHEIIRSEQGEIQDTTDYSRFQTVKAYVCLEPRLSVRLQTGTASSVKASYTRNYQFIHVASVSAVTMPSDIWIPSTSHTRPQFGDQITLGYYRNIHDNSYTASAEAYYKSLKNQVELLYGLGASLQDVSFENSLTRGKGFASGIEFYLQKQTGKVTGSAGYSLAYTERQFDKINQGNPFPAKYDRRHEINIMANFSPDGRWDFSVAFIYATGNATTIPVQMYLLGGNIMTEYGETNAFRMPPYHRLDLSVSYNFKTRGNFGSSLNFSVFNVYNRANPFLIFFDIQGDIVKDHNLSITPGQISIFPIMPSISWNVKI